MFYQVQIAVLLSYMYRISEVRIGGTSRRNFRIFRELCGKESLCNVLIVTTMWLSVEPKVGETREQGLKTSERAYRLPVSCASIGQRLITITGK